nr:hypothetical protein [Tanacetum cinerariifolium]
MIGTGEEGRDGAERHGGMVGSGWVVRAERRGGTVGSGWGGGGGG